eukprot:250879_1
MGNKESKNNQKHHEEMKYSTSLKSEDMLQQLLCMGYDLTASRFALECSNNDINIAIDIINQNIQPEDHDPYHDNSIEIMISMGFAKQQALNAYQVCSKDMHHAIEFLLSRGYNQTDGKHQEEKISSQAVCKNSASISAGKSTYETSYQPGAYTQVTQLSECQQLKRLKVILNEFDRNTVMNIDDVDIQQILDDFFYLFQYHDTDNEFEYIFDVLGGYCNIDNCITLQRQNNGVVNNLGIDSNTSDHQILDKIHWFYRHTFDIGYRLTAKERIMLDDFADRKMNDDLPECEEYIRNKRTIKLNSILSAKQTPSKKLKKYNRLTQEFKKYSLGVLFRYGYDGENICDESAIKVTLKYQSLKEELTSNNIAIINTIQFVKEYRKSQRYLQTAYRRQHYSNMSGEYILSLMIYCNFDQLQYEFSKTYRDTFSAVRHNEFYHLGKNL